LIEASERQQAVRVGVRLELVTIVWMAVEAVLAIGAGIAARSVLLTAFGFDSVIELISGGTLLWRLSSEARGASSERMETVERRATRVSAVLLVLLCAYIVFVGLAGLVARLRPEGSALGVAVAAAAIVVMPLLAWRKRRANLVIGSPALRADIAETITCAYLAAATLVGAGLNLVAGWWWAEYVAALVLLVFIAMETKEGIESAIPSPRRQGGAPGAGSARPGASRGESPLKQDG
jgi:divalent metal cation (Fe/Co/Zn/Cd) transporter